MPIVHDDPVKNINSKGTSADYAAGNALLDAGNYEGAIAAYQKAIAGNDHVADSHYKIGSANYHLKRHETAVNSFNEALKLDPNRADIHNAAGNALRATGRLDDAIVHYRRAAQFSPFNAEFHNNFGLALLDRGKLHYSMSVYQYALKIQSNNADALNNLGVISQRLGKPEEAVRYYWRALDVNPSHVEAHSNLGCALKILGDTDGAMLHCRRALELSPDHANANNNLGAVLQCMGRVEEAIFAYLKAIKACPRHMDANRNLGTALQAIGKIKEARAAFRIAISASPRTGIAYRYLADATKYKGYDAEIKNMEKMLKNPNIRPIDAENFHYALAKAHEDLKNFDKSFFHLLEGNRLHRASINYSPLGPEKLADRIIKAFPSQMAIDSGETDATPIFIIGMPRSGTTLIEQILASHKEVKPAGEITDFYSLVVSAVRNLSETGKEYPEGASELPKRSLIGLGKIYMDSIKRFSETARYITNKLPGNFYYVGLILMALPGAKIINAARNPVDNCLSCFQKLFFESQEFSYNLEELGRFYRNYERLMRHWHKVLPGKILDVQYEEMVSDQEGQTRRLLDFCGLGWDAACLDFHKTERVVSTASLNQVRKPIYKDSVQRWKHYEANLAPLLRALDWKE